MPKIVSERQRFGEVLVQPKRARQRAGDLRDFERMRQPAAIVVAFVIDEYLCFVCEPAERGGVDDPVAVSPEGIAGRTCRLGIAPPPALGRIGCINRPFAPGFQGHSFILGA
jgi:hypothetical protein